MHTYVLQSLASLEEARVLGFHYMGLHVFPLPYIVIPSPWFLHVNVTPMFGNLNAFAQH
jgi:hypothetical protein